MKKNNLIFYITIILLLKSCVFGIGKVEREITDDYWLFANGDISEMSIWYFLEDNSSNIIVEETVFAVGYDDNYIIAKSHPKSLDNLVNKNITYFYIIEIRKPEKSVAITLNQFENKRKQLSIPSSLDFTIVYDEFK